MKKTAKVMMIAAAMILGTAAFAGPRHKPATVKVPKCPPVKIVTPVKAHHKHPAPHVRRPAPIPPHFRRPAPIPPHVRRPAPIPYRPARLRHCKR